MPNNFISIPGGLAPDRRDVREIEDSCAQLQVQVVNLRIQVARLTRRLWQLEQGQYPMHLPPRSLPTQQFPD